ncbi:MAG: hypothetical protein LBP73_01020 [Clostridiales Family XIII bacterium]|nr:hypothetical protein [Clostridiales Family XIII bacterium]
MTYLIMNRLKNKKDVWKDATSVVTILLPFFLGAAVASCFFLSGYNGISENEEMPVISDTGTDDSEILNVIEKSLAENIVYAVNHPIETAYIEEMDEAEESDDRRSLYSKYSMRWKNEAETYMKEITDGLIDNPETQTLFVEYWKYKNSGTPERFYDDMAIYLSGVDNSEMSAEFRMNLNRMNALELICLDATMWMGGGGWYYWVKQLGH